MATWGTTELVILKDTYQPPYTEPGITRIKMLPDPGSPDEPAEILQQAGRTRKTVSFRSFVEALADYNALRADAHRGEVRSYQDFLGVSMNAAIEQLSPPEYRTPNLILFNITLVEA